MKKILCLLMVLVMTLAIFAGCKFKKSDRYEDDREYDEEEDSELYSHLALSEAYGVDFSDFSAEDIYGNSVDESIFEDYDITLVNCWTTWCPYCLQEMPYLNELYEELPSNVNLIGLCNDAYEVPDEYEALMDEFHHSFTMIGATSELNGEVGADYITGFPSTFFVNSRGEIVGQISGVPMARTSRGVDETVVGGYKKLIKDALEIAG